MHEPPAGVGNSVPRNRCGVSRSPRHVVGSAQIFPVNRVRAAASPGERVVRSARDGKCRGSGSRGDRLTVSARATLAERDGQRAGAEQPRAGQQRRRWPPHPDPRASCRPGPSRRRAHPRECRRDRRPPARLGGVRTDARCRATAGFRPDVAPLDMVSLCPLTPKKAIVPASGNRLFSSTRAWLRARECGSAARLVLEAGIRVGSAAIGRADADSSRPRSRTLTSSVGSYRPVRYEKRFT